MIRCQVNIAWIKRREIQELVVWPNESMHRSRYRSPVISGV